MKKKILFLLFVCNIASLCAQLSLVPRAVPSPNTASLGQYGVIPVGHYTGTPHINVPLYELALSGKTFPLSLSYHASGVRVAQDAGWVGMGWSLNAGGCITRSVRGWADFGPGLQKYNPPTYVDAGYIGPLIDEYYKYKDIEENKVDSEPDIFYFNFGSYSGSFFIPKDESCNNGGVCSIVVQKPDCYLDIKYTGGNWVITDGEGFIYYFRIQESTRSRVLAVEGQESRNLYKATSDTKKTAVPLRSVQPEITSAWYLDAIVAPNGQKITFTYDTEKIYTPLAMQETVLERVSGTTQRKSMTTYSFSEITTIILKKISGPNLTIDFTGETRYDIEPQTGYPKPTCISGISISNGQSLIKKYQLEYSYMGTQNNYDNCRLFLNGVHEVGADGQNGGRYAFGYYEGTLPAKISTDIDYWGYYTKPATYMASRCWGTTVVTDTKYSTLIPPYRGTPTCYGQNRNSDADRMRIGTLKWIKYPTGGQTTFTLEPHILESGEVGDLLLPTAQTSKGSVNFDEAYNGYNPGDYRDDFPNGIKTGSPFDVKESGTLTVSLGFSYWADEPSVLDAFWSREKYIATLKKYNSATQSYETLRILDFPKVDESAQAKEVEISVTEGTYTIELSRSFTFPQFNQLVSFDILGYANYTLTQISAADPIGGGLCIRAIESSDLNGNTTRKTYEYVNGTLMSPLIHHRTMLVAIENYQGVQGYGEYLVGTSESYVPLSSSASGNYVGYSIAREYIYEGTVSQGYSEYSFYNDCDEVIKTELYMPGFPTLPRLTNGLVTRKAVYNNLEQLVGEELYRYDEIPGSSALGVKVYKLPLETVSIYIKFYSIHSSWNKLKSKEISEYTPSGQLIWRNTENYTYEPTNYKIKEIEKEDSRANTKIRNVYEYPENLKGADPAYQRLVDSHIVDPVVEERNYIVREGSSSLLNTSRITYNNFHGNLLPASVRYNTAPGSSVLEERMIITDYDTYGQPNGYVKDGLGKTVYLWAYHSQYPVAIIEGATYAQVESWLGSSFISTLADNVLTVDGELQKLRRLLADKNLLVTTYTYRPQVGMLSSTAPNGEVTTYEYDSLGRLSLVKDQDGKITQQYEYNYKQ